MAVNLNYGLLKLAAHNPQSEFVSFQTSQLRLTPVCRCGQNTKLQIIKKKTRSFPAPCSCAGQGGRSQGIVGSV